MSTGAPGVRISVITPCLNSRRYIAAAIESVLEQGCANSEHIVIDGGSTDGTLDILRRYSHLRVVSEPDSGMYDALNKGLAMVNGQFVGFLNADDCYAPDAFASINALFDDESILAVAGQACVFGGVVNDDQGIALRFDPMGSDLLFRSTLGNPSINAWFFRKAVFGRLGNFDSTYQVAGDREFMLRFACSGLRYLQQATLVYRYRWHPESMTFGGGKRIREMVFREHVKMASVYLRRHELSSRARRMITQANSRDTLSRATHAIHRFAVREFIVCCVTGMRHDPIWPLRLANRALTALSRKVIGPLN